jgi:membrane glycosyltransferase
VSDEPQPIEIVSTILLPIKSEALARIIKALEIEYGKDLQMRQLLNRFEFFIERKESDNDHV